jgi:hypothetical protein
VSPKGPKLRLIVTLCLSCVDEFYPRGTFMMFTAFSINERERERESVRVMRVFALHAYAVCMCACVCVPVCVPACAWCVCVCLVHGVALCVGC